MGQYIINGETLTAIADSIRAKTGSSDPIQVSEMAGQIEAITGGGGGGSVDGYCTVTFMNGGEVLFSRLVYIGEDCPDPLAKGYITETPTKASTVDKEFAYAGWNGSLTNITEDTIFEATYTESARKYTISFYDGDTLLTSKQVAYGSTPAHEATKDGYSFEGWTPTPVPVTGDASYYATWSQQLSFAGSSWSDISDACEAGEASKHFSVGDTRTITAGDYTYVLRIIGIDLDNKADGSGKAGLTVMVDSPATDEITYGSYANVNAAYIAWIDGYYGRENTIRAWLQTTFYNRLSADLRDVIKPVTKTTKYFYEGWHTATTQDTVFLPSTWELGDTTSSYNEGTGIIYPYFTNRQKRQFTSDCRHWWTRTSNTPSGVVVVNALGTFDPSTSADATNKYARPFFCI